MNVCFRADLFGDVERALKRLVQSRASVPALQREIVGFLELTENLRLAQHHRIKAARDLEQVMDAVRLLKRVEMLRVGFRLRVSIG